MKSSEEIYDFLDDILYNPTTEEDWTPDFMKEKKEGSSDISSDSMD